MKQKMKFIVIVFGVTLAIFGSLNVNALGDPSSFRCIGSTGACAKIHTANGNDYWLVGNRCQ